MSRNSQAKPIWQTNIAVPGGGNFLYLDNEKAERYNADPDAYAADHFGLSKIEYMQWIDLDGAPLCGHRTKKGDLCRNMTGGYQLRAGEWQKRHRRLFCASHGGEPAHR
ncbi:hypothetical protein AB8B02_15885 [Tardiphaga sp. 862_B3_N4_1]|jgi:hypothetical protein|uniref:hypothetical protein n=1 Tax=Tardiphaga sp. 862_B3_N4_1 TaxID=3240764 RepID=UPI003F23146D